MGATRINEAGCVNSQRLDSVRCCVVLSCRADPFVEVGLSEKGEHLLGAAGEVHLETVIKDLQERFARVNFQVGGG
jgi:hypothetical protein